MVSRNHEVCGFPQRLCPHTVVRLRFSFCVFWKVSAWQQKRKRKCWRKKMWSASFSSSFCLCWLEHGHDALDPQAACRCALDGSSAAGGHLGDCQSPCFVRRGLAPPSEELADACRQAGGAPTGDGCFGTRRCPHCARLPPTWQGDTKNVATSPWASRRNPTSQDFSNLVSKT